MHIEIMFDAIQTFGLVLKRIKIIFCALFGKIEGSLQKIPHFYAEYEH